MAISNSADHESWKEFRQEVSRRLCELRPARAGVGDRDWREPVYGWARNHLPNEANLVHHVAQAEVDRQEGNATKRGNDLLRAYARGEEPLSWAIVGPWPVKVGELRIRLDAATPDDVEDAAQELRRQAKHNYDEVMILAELLSDLAKQARRAGLATVALIGDQPVNEVDEPGDDDVWDDDDEPAF